MFLIYGNDKFLILKQIEKILKKINNESIFSVFKYSILETPINEIINKMITIPLFSVKQIFIINDCNFLTTQKNSILNEEQLQQFFKYCQNEPDFTILILVVNSDNLDNRKKIVQFLKNKASLLPALSLNDQQLQQFISKYIEKRSGTITKKAIELFLENIPSNLNIVVNELDKLVYYNSNIIEADVLKITAKYFENNVFNLTNNLLNKKKKELLINYYQLENANYDQLALIGLIASHLRTIRDIGILKQMSYSDYEISQKLSINPYRVKKLSNDSGDINEKKLNDLLGKLYNLDYNIKTGKIEKKIGLELFLINI